MDNNFSLQSLYRRQANALDLKSDIVLAIQALLENKPICLESILASYPSWEPHVTEEGANKNWKNLLVLTLLAFLAKAKSKELTSQISFLLREPWNERSQYMRALIALNHGLVGLPIPDVSPQLLPSGAALIDLHEHSPWLALPYLPFHAEFGVFLCALALLTKQDDLKATVRQLATWQLNHTLDAHFLPVPGLFVQEKEGARDRLLIWNYLLFYSAYRLTNDKQFEAVAYAQSKFLNRLQLSCSFPLSPLMPLLEKFLEDERNPLKHEDFQLPELIYDPSTALIGRRSSASHVVCTLHGGHTGLGHFRMADAEIVAYGPQYAPLGDCLGFGIEGNHLSDHGLRKPILQNKPQGFSLKGCVRLANQPSSSQLGDFKGIWFEIEQELKENQLQIEARLLGLDGWESVFFSFFVKAEKCRVSSTLSLLPSTFDRYQGNVRALIFEGKEASLKLEAFSHVGSMQVIPLGSENSFWGADFLVAYSMDPNQSHYSWQAAPFSL